MAIYNYVLFLHIVGALMLGVGVAAILLVFSGMRGASTVAEMRSWGGVSRRTRGLAGIASPVLLLSGVYLAFISWGWTTPWIDVALVLMLVMSQLGPRVIGPRFGKVGAALAQSSDGSITPEIHRLRDDRTLWIGVACLTALYLSVIYLMTVKPELLGSLVTVAVALAVGIGGALALRSRLAGGAGSTRAPVATGASH